MPLNLITGMLPLGKILTILSIIATLSGGAVWLYNAIKAQGVAQAQLEQQKAAYAQLRLETGEAIAKLNANHARDMQAAAERERDGDIIEANQAAAIAELEKELDDARKNGDTCLDTPLPPGRARRVRELAEAGGRPGGAD